MLRHMADTILRQMRQGLGLSLREVSRRSGINPGRLSIIERGVPPTEDEMRRIREALYRREPAA